MKASDYIAQFFVDKGVKVVFGYVGGMITHLVDSLNNNPHIHFVQTYHEQTAAIAAEGYALESGKTGVAIATSGPGATNLITGIADAYFGNIPTIFITGQVNTYEYKYDKPIRQQGFQEADVISIVKPITKYAVMVTEASRLVYELEKAYHIAVSGRKGPVLIDLPMDISRAEISLAETHHFFPSKKVFTSIDLSVIRDVLNSAKRPLILIGGGCRDCKDQLRSFIERYRIPFVTSLMGKGLGDEENPLYCGLIGSYGNRSANMIISQSDVLIALGSRLDTRQTGALIDGFMPHGRIIHVDIDENELNFHRLSNRIPVNTEVSTFLNSLDQSKISVEVPLKWTNWIDKIKKKYNQKKEVERFVVNKAPYEFFEIFNLISKDNTIITTDIGQNQMWAAQSIIMKKDQKFFTSGGLAPMGFSLPAAVGAAFASPNKTIYCFNGDGGFHMACQSLLLISQYGLNIKVIVLNNETLGMITQFQHLYFNDRMVGTTCSSGYCLPNFQAMADCYRLPYVQIQSSSLTFEKLDKAFSNDNCIINFRIDGLTSVSPKLEYNQPIYNVSPYLPDDEIISLNCD